MGAFNPIQTQAFSALYNTDDNALVAAPTGSGKTLCAEFALLRMLARAEQGKCQARCVYVAPVEALAKERLQEWSAKFGDGLGLTVVELTGQCAGRWVGRRRGQTRLEARIVRRRLACAPCSAHHAPGGACRTPDAAALLARFSPWHQRRAGETAADLKLLERGNVVISTPARWDMLSRRWRQRKAVQGVALFVVDELHLLGSETGPTLEVVCSRMRYMAAQLEGAGGAAPRIVGLGHSMADAKDVGEWLGAPTHALFAFPPGVRPVPLEIHITGMDIINFEARMQAMSRPCYAAVLQHASGAAGRGASSLAVSGQAKPAVVFVPSRKPARLLALDLLTAAAADGEPNRFRLAEAAVRTALGARGEGKGATALAVRSTRDAGRVRACVRGCAQDIEPLLGRVRDPALKHSLAYGVGLLSETQSPQEQAVVRLLFESGAIQVSNQEDGSEGGTKERGGARSSTHPRSGAAAARPDAGCPSLASLLASLRWWWRRRRRAGAWRPRRRWWWWRAPSRTMGAAWAAATTPSRT